MPSVDWGSSSLTAASDQRVYIRQYWADAWVLQPNIWCSDVSWSLLPSIPVAQLSLEYGSVLPHGALAYTTQAKIDIAGWYVKIEVDAGDGTMEWYGFIDEVADEQGGVSSGIPSGTLRFVAYGMIQILAHAFFTRSRWFDEPLSTLRWSGSAINFNDQGKPNRTDMKPAGADSHVFMPRGPEKFSGTGGSFFTPNTYWSTYDILEYIESYANPRDNTGQTKIQISFPNSNVAPNWDKPTVETEGRSVLDVLNELVNASRLMQISARVTNNVVDIVIHSLAESAITLEGGKTHDANTSLLTLQTWAAQDTSVVVQDSLSRRAVQVVAKGAKRQSVVTVQIAKKKGENRGLIEAFDDFDRLTYDRGASTAAGYGALTDEKKKEANQRVRAQAKLTDTYKTFALHPQWSFWIGGDPVFAQQSAIGTFQYFPYWGSVQIVDRLPLKELFNYDTAVPITTVPFPIIAFADKHLTQSRKPFVLFERPSETKYIDAEKMANGDDPKFACYVGLSKEDQAVALDVTGAYQHAIAYARFTPLTVDIEDNGQWDYLDAYCTIALQEDRYLESIYPDNTLLPTVDVVRRKLIYAGESYERVYVAPETVYDVSDDGALRKVNNGTAVENFRNDEPALSSLAEIAATWVLTTRKVCRLVSGRPTAQATVGQLLTTLNSDTPHAATINTIVSDISVSMRRGQDLPIAVAEFSLTTAMGELDPLAFVPRLRKTVA